MNDMTGLGDRPWPDPRGSAPTVRGDPRTVRTDDRTAQTGKQPVLLDDHRPDGQRLATYFSFPETSLQQQGSPTTNGADLMLTGVPGAVVPQVLQRTAFTLD